MLQQSRIIIRNLSFQCEENDLRAIFSKFGTVSDVSIPTKLVNKRTIKLGCGFVQFKVPAHAKIALAAMNLQEIKGRQVVVDWAVSKDKYDESKKKEGKFHEMFTFFLSYCML